MPAVPFLKRLIMISESNKTSPFFKFESLRIYHKSVDFSNAIVTLSNHCQTEAHHRLVSLFITEATQITSNIIEGSSLPKNEFADQLQKSKSCIGRCVALCTLAQKQHLIDETQETDIRNELMELTKMIGALILSFQKHESASNFDL